MRISKASPGVRGDRCRVTAIVQLREDGCCRSCMGLRRREGCVCVCGGVLPLPPVPQCGRVSCATSAWQGCQPHPLQSDVLGRGGGPGWAAAAS